VFTRPHHSRKSRCARLALGLSVALLSLSGARAENGTLLFSDDFDRADASATKDGLGREWGSNSDRRAAGQKQAFLRDGTFQLTTAPGADHNAVAFHAIEPAFGDGSIQIRFRMEADEFFAVDFNNPECDTVHSGHIINVAFRPDGVTIKDSKTGAMNLKIRTEVKAGRKTPAITALIKNRSKTLRANLADGAWHEASMIKRGDILTVQLDGKTLGQFQSPGITHDTINKVSISAKSSPLLDDLNVYSLR
jgi:hypothetical protein